MSGMTDMPHELHVTIPERFYSIIFKATQKTGHKTVSNFVRKTLAEKCKDVFNGQSMIDETLEEIEYLEELTKGSL